MKMVKYKYRAAGSSSTVNETVNEFIQMTDEIKRKYKDQFELILENIGLKRNDIDNLKFNHDQFLRLLHFYLLPDDKKMVDHRDRALFGDEIRC